MQLAHPLPGARVSQHFGENPHRLGYGSGGHQGVDLACPRGVDLAAWFRTPVRAAHDGVAALAPSARGGVGVLLLGEGQDTFYCHLDEATVVDGRSLRAGEVLGFVGHTGDTYPAGLGGTHLHFGWRPHPVNWGNGTNGYEDPWPLLAEGGDMVTKSKLGAHHNVIPEHLREEMLAFYRAAQPNWGLIIECGERGADFVRALRDVSPRTRLLGRVHYWMHEQHLDDPAGRAREVRDRITTTALWAAGVRDWQGYNEIPGYPYLPNDGSERVLQYLRFDRHLAGELAAVGGRLWCGAWSVGNPDYAWWGHPLMGELLRACPRLLLHEYCAPVLNDLRAFDPPVPSGGWEEYLTSGHYLLRYRQVLARLRAAGVPLPRLLISECGIDTGAANTWDPGTAGQKGWRFYYAHDPGGYLQQLAWYDRQLQMDDEVEGALHFCYGTEDHQWDSFDIVQDLAPALAAHIGAVPPGLAEVADALWAACAAQELPYNPEAAFMQVALAEGWQMKSPEVDVPTGYRGQLFLDPHKRPWEKVLIYTRIGDWDPAHFTIVRRPN